MTNPTLADCRLAIDALDTQILELLKKRTEVVEQVATLKRQNGETVSYMRPGREAQVLRRLLAQDTGAIPKPLVAQLWREIMMASLQLEQPFSVAVYQPAGEAPDYATLTRNHFGAATPLLYSDSTGGVLRLLREKKAMLGVLPLPEHDTVKNPWWPALRFRAPLPLNIIFKLPFSENPATPATRGAYAVGAVALEDSGQDAHLWCVQTTQTISRQQLKESLTGQGAEVESLHPWYEEGASSEQTFLITLKGAPSALPEPAQTLLQGLGKADVVGCYAVPL